jgi:hypothetical protein
VGIDLDGVVVDFAATANRWLATYLNVSEQPVDQWNWYLNYDHPDRDVAWKSMWREFNHGDLFGQCEPVVGAGPAVQLLDALGHEVVFITHRNPSTAAVTAYWLDVYGLNFPVVYERDKWTFSCDVYVDDKPENVYSLIDNHKRAILFDQPWNKGCPGLTRRIGWLDTLAEIHAVEYEVWRNENVVPGFTPGYRTGRTTDRFDAGFPLSLVPDLHEEEAA